METKAEIKVMKTELHERNFFEDEAVVPADFVSVTKCTD